MPFGIQPIHIVFIVIVALIIFGPKRLPDLGRYVGRTINEFRTGTRELTEAIKEESMKDPSAPQAPAAAQAAQPGNTILPPAQPQAVSADQKFCIKCGAPNLSEAIFCQKCGNQFSA